MDYTVYFDLGIHIRDVEDEEAAYELALQTLRDNPENYIIGDAIEES